MTHLILGEVLEVFPDPDKTGEYDHWQGGTVTLKVVREGSWIGWVGDGRKFNGSTFGARKWFACWRQDGDTAARWCSELEFPSKKRALIALVSQAGGEGGGSEREAQAEGGRH